MLMRFKTKCVIDGSNSSQRNHYSTRKWGHSHFFVQKMKIWADFNEWWNLDNI